MIFVKAARRGLLEKSRKSLTHPLVVHPPSAKLYDDEGENHLIDLCEIPRTK
jgi:hypothetical protein